MTTEPTPTAEENSRPAFHVDDELRKAAFKAAKCFEKEGYFSSYDGGHAEEMSVMLIGKANTDGTVEFLDEILNVDSQQFILGLQAQLTASKAENERMREAVDQAAEDLNHIRNKAYSGDEFEFMKIAEDGLKKLRPFLTSLSDSPQSDAH